MSDTFLTGFDLDAIYNGDNTATGDAIRLLVQLASQNKGVQPLLSDKLIIPKFSPDGFIVESEDGQRILTLGAGGGTAGQPGSGTSSFSSDVEFLGRIKLGPIVDVADGYSPGDTTFGLGFGNADFIGIGNTIYRVAPTANGKSICGIYCATATADYPNNHSHLITIWNDSAFYIPVDSSIAGVTNGRKILSRFYLGPQGTALLVHDEHDDGWRLVALNNPLWSTYTPVFVSTGTQPTMGASTVAGRWKDTGGAIEYEAQLTLGAGFSFGTGQVGLTVPVAPSAASPTIRMHLARYADVGTADYAGTAQHQVINALPAVRLQTLASPIAPISATVPFTFVSGDILGVSGKYPWI